MTSGELLTCCHDNMFPWQVQGSVMMDGGPHYLVYSYLSSVSIATGSRMSWKHLLPIYGTLSMQAKGSHFKKTENNESN